MKNILLSLFAFSTFSMGHAVASPFFLPEDFEIYTDGTTVINWQPSTSYQKRHLPTFNFYEGEEGGYVAIYTHNQDVGVYGVGEEIYVMGQIRVEGHYEGRLFVPKGYKLGDDFSQDPELLQICESYFPSMAGEMWVGGDTGGWFGIQL
jgi:hypothetical protein